MRAFRPNFISDSPNFICDRPDSLLFDRIRQRPLRAFSPTSGAKNRFFGNQLLPEIRETTAFSRLFFR